MARKTGPPKKRSATLADVEVGRRMRIARVKKGLSQQKLATALGLTFQQVQKYEKGVNKIGFVRAFEICRLLSIDPLHLGGWDGENFTINAPVTATGVKLLNALETGLAPDMKIRLVGLIEAIKRANT